MKKPMILMASAMYFLIALSVSASNPNPKQQEENVHKRFLFGHIVKNGIKSEKTKVALIFEKEGERSTDYFAYQVQYESGAEVITEDAATSDIDVVIQLLGDETYEFHRYENGWTKILRSGKIYLAQNPQPTTKNKLLSKAAEAAKDYARDEMKKQADSQAEKQQINEQASEADWSFYYDEYLVKEGANGEWKVITRDNAEKWALNLLQDCQAYKKRDKDKQKRLTDPKMKYIMNTVLLYNRDCN